MIIDRNLVEYIAALSKLRISEEEMISVCNDLSSIINYIDEINSSIDTINSTINTNTVAVGFCVNELTNVMREDQVVDSMNRTELLENAPEHTAETPIVPKTFE